MGDILDAEYWEARYTMGRLGWDLGHPSRALVHIIDQLRRRDLKILVPGAGNGYEVAYLYEKGFDQVYMVDWAEAPINNFQKRYPNFPRNQLIQADFFDLSGSYDLILEQTFFCSLNPNQRQDYVEKMYNLLASDGLLAGVLFNAPLYDNRPPFGGNKALYLKLFRSDFHIEKMKLCEHSDPSRLGMELEIRLRPRIWKGSQIKKPGRNRPG